MGKKEKTLEEQGYHYNDGQIYRVVKQTATEWGVEFKSFKGRLLLDTTGCVKFEQHNYHLLKDLLTLMKLVAEISHAETK